MQASRAENLSKEQQGSSKKALDLQSSEIQIEVYFDMNKANEVNDKLTDNFYAWEGLMNRWRYEDEHSIPTEPVLIVEHDAKIYTWCSFEVAVAKVRLLRNNPSFTIVWSEAAKEHILQHVDEDCEYKPKKITNS